MFRKRQIIEQCIYCLIASFGRYLCYITYLLVFLLGFMDTGVVSLWPQKNYHLKNKFNHEF